MNAPLNDAVRKALENVTLDEPAHRAGQYMDTVDSAAGHRGFGIQPLRQGGLP